jgi:methionyl-tRNA formyltransferase
VDGYQTGTVPGRVRGRKERCLVIETGRGTVGIRELQLPGKKKLQARDFLRGVSIPEGSILGIEHKC